MKEETTIGHHLMDEDCSIPQHIRFEIQQFIIGIVFVSYMKVIECEISTTISILLQEKQKLPPLRNNFMMTWTGFVTFWT